jgi:hypothetical protein
VGIGFCLQLEAQLKLLAGVQLGVYAGMQLGV